MNIYVKLVILTPVNKVIIHLEQNISDFKLQLARKIRTAALSLYRKMSSLGVPVITIFIFKEEHNASYITVSRQLFFQID